MRFGYCLDLSHILLGDDIFQAVRTAGYDYIETQLTKLLALPPAEYGVVKRRLAETGLPCLAAMMVFPHDMPLVSEGRDLRVLEEHAKRTLAIAADLGCETVVFGHGGTRRVPVGMDYGAARARLTDVLRVLDGMAAALGLKSAV